MTRLRRAAVLSAVLLVAPALTAHATIRLNSVAIDAARPPAVPEALRARSGESLEGDVALVQFPGPITREQRRRLDAATVRVFTYLPDNAFLVRLPAGKGLRAAGREIGASWVGAYHPLYKISKDVAAVAAPAASDSAADATSPPRVRSVFVQVFPDSDLAEAVQKIRGLGIKDVAGARKNPFFSRLRLLLTDAEIARYREDLARLSEVFWVDLEPRRSLLNDTTIWVGQSGLSAGQTTPVFTQGIFGEGQTIAIIDTGLDADMCYFRDTARGLPPTNLCNGGTVTDPAQRKVIAVDFLWQNECNGGVASNEWDTQSHGTHVSGTAAGDNFSHPLTHDTADGMAPGAKLVMQDAGFLTDNCGDLPGIGCPVVDLNPIFQQAYTQGARLHSNSWGDNENGAVQNNYSAGSEDVDQFMWNHKDFLVLFAAGNAGPGTGSVGSP